MNIEKLESLIHEISIQIKNNLVHSHINIDFIVKIKDIEKSRSIAVYRGGTIRRGDKAIIWISPNFPQILSQKTGLLINDFDFEYSLVRNLEDSICHELIHAFQDLLGMYSQQGSDFNEEEAESLGLALARGESIENSELIKTLTSYVTKNSN